MSSQQFQIKAQTVVEYSEGIDGDGSIPECLCVTAVVRNLNELKPSDDDVNKHTAYYVAGLSWSVDGFPEAFDIQNAHAYALARPEDRYHVFVEVVLKEFVIPLAETIHDNVQLVVS